MTHGVPQAADPEPHMRITDLKIGTRLTVGFATMLLITSAITGIAIWRLSRVADLTRQTLQVPLEKERLASDWYRLIALGARRSIAIAKSSDPSLIEYAVQLAHASREPGRVGLTDLARYVTFGASPRSSISLVLAARALAYVRGREYVVPEDLTDLALDVMRHRLGLSYEALSDEVSPDLILSKIMANLPIPEPAGRGR